MNETDAALAALMHNLLQSDAPAQGAGPASVGRRIGPLAWLADYGEDSELVSLVIEDNLPTDSRDVVDAEGRCLGCRQPLDRETLHGYPVCRSKVTISGRER
jgi:hypothetical protein